MEAVKKKKTLKRLLILIGAELALVAVFVWVMDPFYQYHAPFFGMEAVLNDRDNQMPGTIRNFDYDSVLVGSSVAENFDSAFLDETYDCRTLKIIRASGSIADLLYYLEMAQDEQDIRNVFWCLDLPALEASTEVTLYGGSTPRYLHTRTILDDLPYLYNKEILLEKVPAMLAYSYMGINTGGDAYNWASDKEFGPAKAMLVYDRNSIVLEGEPQTRDYSAQIPQISENIAMLTEQVESHPQVQYRFVIPPFSMLWWDCAYVNGELERRYFVLNQAVSALLGYENVEIYYFQNEDFIVCNLDYYMDMVHYSPDVNQYMLDSMAAGKNRVRTDDWGEAMEGLHRLLERITKEEIYRYYGL